MRGAYTTNEDPPTRFAQRCTGDFLVCQSTGNMGIHGFHDALNMRDLGTGNKMCYPTDSRTTANVVDSFKRFVGTDLKKMDHFYGDGEHGLIKACDQEKIP